MPIYFAFPGMGKTPLAKEEPNVIDLDFGHFRVAHGVSKEDESQLLDPFANFAIQYLKEGWVVLTNEPKLMSTFINKGIRPSAMRVYLPDTHHAAQYCANKLGVDLPTVLGWIRRWKETADECGIKVHKVKVGLDHYLRGHM